MTRVHLYLILLITFFISGCASNKNKQPKPESGPVIQAPISVGSILTKLEILEYASYNLPENQIRAKVLEVIGYGANTEILRTDTILTLSFNNSGTLSSLSNIEEGEVIEALISKSMQGLNASGSTSVWRIVELKN
tara:strand:+ start:1461 stop:1868 length:408 start_codon:yes stop_codon:yes gene_type:complete